MKLNIYFIFALILSSACDGKRVYEQKITFDNIYWHKDNVANFEFSIEDQSLDYNLYYTLRNSGTYLFHNLYVNYELQDSTGHKLNGDLQELILFDPKTGKPRGSGSGDLFDHKIPILENFRFDSPGTYRFQITQYMRMDSILDIASIGLRIERAN